VNQKFIIEGGRPLSGTVVPAGNKNAALPILAACLLTDEEVTLDNVPQIVDVHTMVALLDDIGVSVREDGPNTLVLRADNIRHTTLDPELSGRLRASLLVAGPLLARCGEVETAVPGGDFIGRRRVDTHMLGFRSLGAEVDSGRTYEIRAPRGLHGADIFLDEASVTATENLLCAAVLAPGETVMTPRTHVLCMRGDLDSVIQALNEHIRREVLPPPVPGRDMLVEANHRGYIVDHETEAVDATEFDRVYILLPDASKRSYQLFRLRYGGTW